MCHVWADREWTVHPQRYQVLLLVAVVVDTLLIRVVVWEITPTPVYVR